MWQNKEVSTESVLVGAPHFYITLLWSCSAKIISSLPQVPDSLQDDDPDETTGDKSGVYTRGHNLADSQARIPDRASC